MGVVIDTANVADHGAAPLADGSDLRLVPIPGPLLLLGIRNGGASPIPVPGPGLRHGRRRPSPDPGPRPHVRRKNPVPVLAPHLLRTKKSSHPRREMLHLVLSWSDLGSRTEALHRPTTVTPTPDPRLPLGGNMRSSCNYYPDQINYLCKQYLHLCSTLLPLLPVYSQVLYLTDVCSLPPYPVATIGCH